MLDVICFVDSCRRPASPSTASLFSYRLCRSQRSHTPERSATLLHTPPLPHFVVRRFLSCSTYCQLVYAKHVAVYVNNEDVLSWTASNRREACVRSTVECTSWHASELDDSYCGRYNRWKVQQAYGKQGPQRYPLDLPDPEAVTGS